MLAGASDRRHNNPAATSHHHDSGEASSGDNGLMHGTPTQLATAAHRGAAGKLTHGSLFTGIGAFDLALECANFKTVWQVEKDDFARRVLEKHWPNVPKFSDVKECGVGRKYELASVDLISGGFPCQDLSSAGKRRGLGTPANPTARSGLWFEFRRIVAEMRPRWVLVESVCGLKDLGGDEVLSGMEALGYSCWPLVVGAGNLGAPHGRKRVWILCRRNDECASVQ